MRACNKAVCADKKSAGQDCAIIANILFANLRLNELNKFLLFAQKGQLKVRRMGVSFWTDVGLTIASASGLDATITLCWCLQYAR